MKQVFVLGLAAFALVVSSATSPLTAQGGAGPSYTEEQSTRGEGIYTKTCSFCHEDQSMAPALKGDGFLKNWSDKTAGALFDKIQMTMPANEPGSLNEQQAADLIAFILKQNKFPAGQQPLPKDAASLGAIALTPK